mgnify:CR=1 FL=1
MFTTSPTYYVENPGNSREIEQEEKCVRQIVRMMKPHGVEVYPKNITRTVVNLEIPTSLGPGSEVSAELFKVIASIKGELRNSYICIKRPKLLSYGQLGMVYSLISMSIFLLWWYIKDFLDNF